MKEVIYKSDKELKSFKNLFLHGVFFTLYGFVKYLSFPFCNYLRFLIIKIFAPNIKTQHILDAVTIHFPWKIKIDRNTTINEGCMLNGYGGITIGEGVRMAKNVTINSVNHNFDDPSEFIYKQGLYCSEVIIEDDVWIGANVCVNMGVTIGKGSIVGSGSIVVKDIPPYSIAVGVPAKVIKSRKS